MFPIRCQRSRWREHKPDCKNTPAQTPPKTAAGSRV